MLLGIITKILVLVCLLDILSARPQSNPKELSPTQEAIQKINPELDKITSRLKALKSEIYRTLLDVFVELHSSISESEKQLLREIDNVELNINKVIETTNKNNLDIDACLCKQKEQVEKILMIANNKANQNFDGMQIQINNLTEKAQGIIKEADDIERNMNKIIGYCIRQNNLSWQKEKLVECLFLETKDLNGIVDGLYETKNLIQNNIKNALCKINVNQNNLFKWLSNTQVEFFQCVSQADLSTEEYSLSVEDKTEIAEISEISEKNEKVKNEDSIVTDKNEEDNQRIFDRIKKLEALVDQLRNLYQVEEEVQNSKSSLISTENKFNKHTTEKNFGNVDSENKNEKYLLYISF
ncbi:hypothetical protein ILUMI_03159 [Ignelater luminosus]|uniref:Uncharacterized protein n=1 Tax=Ignelater luminosus TaxID=2038154 RepID=A0A8K0GIL2_IGNLU|nr:hypothetical protein ILUMI_03159 [Ignelater luminosus]